MDPSRRSITTTLTSEVSPFRVRARRKWTDRRIDQSISARVYSDRGRCYFAGHISLFTSMWQHINLRPVANIFPFDNFTVKFHLSAWLGGWDDNNDNARIGLEFYSRTSEILGQNVTLGPVLAVHRQNISCLLYRETTGTIPVGAAAMIVRLTISRTHNTYNDGYADDLVLRLSIWNTRASHRT